MNCNSLPQITGYRVTASNMTLLVTDDFFKALESKLGKISLTKDFFVAVVDGTDEVVGVSSPFRIQNGKTQTDIIIWGEDELGVEGRSDFGVGFKPNTFVSIYFLKGATFYKIGSSVKYVTNYFAPLMGNTSVVKYCTPNWTEESYGEYVNSLHDWWKSNRGANGTYDSWLRGDYPLQYDEVFDDNSPAFWTDKLERIIDSIDEPKFYRGLCVNKPNLKVIHPTGDSHNVIITKTILNDIESKVGALDYDNDFFIAISNKTGRVVGVSSPFHINNQEGVASMAIFGQEPRFQILNEELYNFYKDRLEKEGNIFDFGVPKLKDAEFTVLLLKDNYKSPKNILEEINRFKLYSIGNPIKYQSDGITILEGATYEHCGLRISDAEYNEVQNDKWDWWERSGTNLEGASIKRPEKEDSIIDTPDLDYIEDVEDVLEITDPIDDIVEDLVENDVEDVVEEDVSRPTINYDEDDLKAVTRPASEVDRYQQGFEDGVDSVDITVDNQGFYNKGFGDGVASVDITSDNDAVFSKGYNAGVASVDITSDNQGIYDEAFQKGVDSVDTTPQIVEVEKKKNNYAIPTIIGVVALFMLFGKK